MLKNLLKFELKASGRILLPIYGALIALGIISGIFVGIKPSFEWDNQFLSLIQILIIIIYFTTFVAAEIFAVIISIIRFKKNLLGSEGYLMHTLPATEFRNISAKLIVAMCFQILSVVAACVSIIMFSFTTLIINGGLNKLLQILDINEILIAWDQIKNLLTSQMIVNFALYILEAVILGITVLAGFNLMIYASMAIGYSFNTGKTAKSVLTYIAFYVASQIINMILTKIFFLITTNIPSGYAAPHILLIGLCVLYFMYAAAYFFITGYFLKNKLNLQ